MAVRYPEIKYSETTSDSIKFVFADECDMVKYQNGTIRFTLGCLYNNNIDADYEFIPQSVVVIPVESGIKLYNSLQKLMGLLEEEGLVKENSTTKE